MKLKNLRWYHALILIPIVMSVNHKKTQLEDRAAQVRVAQEFANQYHQDMVVVMHPHGYKPPTYGVYVAKLGQYDPAWVIARMYTHQ